MAILTFPNVSADSESWSMVANTQTFTSPHNGATQTAALPGARWGATLTYTNRDGVEAKKLQAFLTALRGRAGRFYLSPHDSTPNGTATGSGLVNGASQTGGSLITDGWGISQALLFAAGDYIEVNGELKQVSADVASDVSGNATITFSPDLNQSPPDNAQIISTSPRAVMRLEDDDQSQWSFQSPVIYAISFSCVEALDV